MAIKVENITFSYPDSSVTAVENVSMTIEKGERVAIIGQNGAGKSTLIKILCGVYASDRGEIWVDGERSRRRRRLLPM